ncbi:peptidase M1 [Novacetimonas cocois]|uniref:Peptidase M1 n=2 Tax=Novacetimonas cocois TaxID=1747507 RepID=A0A365Z080_9PROT|nr:peptidase M1 [Novacetimonas cocois]
MNFHERSGRYRLLLLGCMACIASAPSAWAREKHPSGMTSRAPAIFMPQPMPDRPTVFRSAAGVPGHAYWQNRADYAIHATITPETRTLSGEETITYTNNSPDGLDEVWLNLDQNIYQPGARSQFASDRFSASRTDGVRIEKVVVEYQGIKKEISPVISDTRMQLRLPATLRAKGGRARIHVTWHYVVPGPWGGRTSVTPSRNGDIYEIAQWYPRMAVYDDIRGWDTAPYLGQEFYLEYGNIDYRVTVPWNYTVAGSGTLLNPDRVLSAVERRRLSQAARSDTRVMIRTAQDVTDPGSHRHDHGNATWHFRMDNTRDVAFAASPAFIWDAARMNLPSVRGVTKGPHLAMSVYPVEGVGADGWDRSTEYVKHAIEYFSAQWYPYPWQNAINLGGHGAGMEYPGIVFDGMEDRGPQLFWITTHELGHGWFPMIVGSNERRNAFMDEGFNTFIDVYASDHFNHGEFAPKKDNEFAPQTGNPADDIVPLLRDRDAPTLMTPSDLVQEKYRHPVTYFKGAYGLKLLREQIIGPERFDPAFRRYIQVWAFHHPTPSDFFRFLGSETGEDLSWFWRGWYFENQAPDYACTAIHPDTNGYRVTVRNKGGLPIPVVMQMTYMDGSTQRRTIPTEAWYQHDAIDVPVTTHGVLRTVTLDPDHAIPDIDRTNNTLRAP